MEQNEIMEKAKSMGWVEEDLWKGDPEKWRPAEEFVERGENIVPILRDRVEKLEEELKMSLKVNKAEIEDIKKAAFEQAKKDFDKKIAEIRKEKFEAVQTGDVAKYTELEQAEKKLEEPEAPKVKATPVFEEWRDKNPWYQKDDELTEYAEFIAAKLQKTNPGMDEKAFYLAVENKVKTAHADKFTNPEHYKGSKVEGGGRSGGGKGKTFADLPDTAKSAYSRLAKKFEMKGRKLDKDTYVKEYFEE